MLVASVAKNIQNVVFARWGCIHPSGDQKIMTVIMMDHSCRTGMVVYHLVWINDSYQLLETWQSAGIQYVDNLIYYSSHLDSGPH